MMQKLKDDMLKLMAQVYPGEDKVLDVLGCGAVCLRIYSVYTLSES